MSSFSIFLAICCTFSSGRKPNSPGEQTKGLALVCTDFLTAFNFHLILTTLAGGSMS